MFSYIRQKYVQLHPPTNRPTTMACCTRNCCLIAQGIIGTLLALVAVVLVVLWPDMYRNIFDSSVVLTDTSYSYSLWKETPLPMTLELYLYNFTNSQEVAANPDVVKPNFEECGPYVFKEHHIKGNITWNANGTVTFLQRRIWAFDKQRTNGSLSDQISNVNVIAVTAAYFVRGNSNLIRIAVNAALKAFGEHAVVTRTARELLFEGYEDRLLHAVNVLHIPGLTLPFDKFGWFYGRNESDLYDGWFTIHTGARDLNKLGNMDLWNFRNTTDFYDGECAAVKGTTGELFPPRTNPDQITVFASDICSHMSLTSAGNVEVEGLTGRLFRGDALQFDNGWNYPNTSCFSRVGDERAPSGARNVSLCKFGAPAFVSYPHFYLADSSYTNRITGVTPNPDVDGFEMAMELTTGIPLFVSAQLQINILVQRIPHITFFDTLPDKLYIPVLRFKQEVRITPELAKQAWIALNIENIISIVFYCLIGLGVMLVVSAIFIVSKYPMRRSESQSTLVDE